MIGHHARFRENDDLPLWRGPAAKKKPPFFNARARGCFPSKSSGSFTGFLILRSAGRFDDFSSFDTVSSRGLDECTVNVGWLADVTSGVVGSAKPLSLQNGFNMARGVAAAWVSELSSTSERTNNWLTSSKSCLKGFCGDIGVEHHCHQCEIASIQNSNNKRPRLLHICLNHVTMFFLRGPGSGPNVLYNVCYNKPLLKADKMK